MFRIAVYANLSVFCSGKKAENISRIGKGQFRRGLIEEFDTGIWSSLVQEMIVKAKDDIVFKFKKGFEVRV